MSTPEFWDVEIIYQHRDCQGAEHDQSTGVNITATVDAVDEHGDTVKIGDLTLTLIDLDDDPDLFAVLDGHSSEHASYFPVIDEHLQFDDRAVLIADRLRIIPEYRGLGLGHHVLARALRTFGRDALIVLTAAPVGHDDDSTRGEIAGKLRSHWEQLGLEHVANNDDGHCQIPILAGRLTDPAVSTAVADHASRNVSNIICQ
jgi:GNAT superfamily N-acetyltransferase